MPCKKSVKFESLASLIVSSLNKTKNPNPQEHKKELNSTFNVRKIHFETPKVTQVRRHQPFTVQCKRLNKTIIEGRGQERKEWKNWREEAQGNTIETAKIMRRKERLHYALQKEIGGKVQEIRRRYMVNHPVVQLLEKNMKSIDMKDLFLSEKGFSAYKNFNGTANFEANNPFHIILSQVPPSLQHQSPQPSHHIAS